MKDWKGIECAYCGYINPVVVDADSIKYKCRKCSKVQQAVFKKPEPVKVEPEEVIETPNIIIEEDVVEKPIKLKKSKKVDPFVEE